MEMLCCPSSKTDCYIRLNTITDGNNYIQIIMFNFPLYLTISFFLNYKEFLYSCLAWKLSIFINILNMLAYILSSCVVDFCKLHNSYPHIFFSKAN